MGIALMGIDANIYIMIFKTVLNSIIFCITFINLRILLLIQDCQIFTKKNYNTFHKHAKHYQLVRD